MTPAEKLEHVRWINREKDRRRRVRLRNGPAPKTTAREARIRDGARCYDWERLLPYIDKQPDGHWLWRGSFKMVYQRLRPVVRAGAYGVERADHVVCCLSHGRPPPKCFVVRLCDNIECVAPAHLGWSNLAVETAKRRRRHHDEEELVRQ